MVTIGLVTVLYKSDDVLEGFFKSVSAQTFKDYHLYIIDNTPGNSTRTLIKDLSRQFPLTGFIHIENASNVGVARGNNQGIEMSMADNCVYTILLNNDIEFDQQDLFERMYHCAESRPESMIIPKIFYNDTRRIWMAGGVILRRKGIVFHLGDGQEDGPRFNKPRYFQYAPTCFMLIANKVFSAVGLIDEKYFVYYDDTDFSFRASQKGFKIFYMPDLHIYHKVSSSTGGRESLVSIYYNTRNRIYFIRKNFKWYQKGIPLIYTLITRGVRWFLYDRKQADELVRGIGDGFKMSVR